MPQSVTDQVRTNQNQESLNMSETATVTYDQKQIQPDTARVAPPALSKDEIGKIHAYWRACNYLAAGMIYLRANPLLREPLKVEHIKQRLLGHWGASRGPREPPWRFEIRGRDSDTSASCLAPAHDCTLATARWPEAPIARTIQGRWRPN